VAHHTTPIAVYRFHEKNMSSNIPKMLITVLKVLGNQKTFIKTQKEKAALSQGEKIWIDYYSAELYQQLSCRNQLINMKEFKLLFRFQPKFLLKYFTKKITDYGKKTKFLNTK
jgi:hypothetical protein